MECRLSKVYESIKLFRGGHGQQRVGVEPEKRSRKRGVSVSGETRGRTSLILPKIYTPHPMIYLPNLCTSLETTEPPSCQVSPSLVVWEPNQLSMRFQLRMVVGLVHGSTSRWRVWLGDKSACWTLGRSFSIPPTADVMRPTFLLRCVDFLGVLAMMLTGASLSESSAEDE